jgi:hypothetical protein
VEEFTLKQRRFPRIQLRTKVFIKSPNRAFSAESRNLSIHGVFIKTSEAVEQHANIEVDIMIPCASRCPYMKIKGIVTRAEHSGFAVEFRQIDPEIFQCLINVIRKRLPHQHKPFIAP